VPSLQVSCLLVLYYILNKLIKTIYSSCNKTVIYLLAGKYAVDIDRKNRYLPWLSPRSITIFYVNITAYFPANK